MSSKVLADLVADVINTGSPQVLSADETSRFYSEFEVSVASEVEEMRSEKRRAYEEFKNIAIR